MVETLICRCPLIGINFQDETFRQIESADQATLVDEYAPYKGVCVTPCELCTIRRPSVKIIHFEAMNTEDGFRSGVVECEAALQTR